MARLNLITVVVVASFFGGGYCSVKGSGNMAYYQVAGYWEKPDGEKDFGLPTVQELAANNLSVQPNATEFTIAFHLKNMGVGAYIFRLVPPGFDWSAEAVEKTSVCSIGASYPGIGMNLWGSDCAADKKGSACVWDPNSGTTRLVSRDTSPFKDATDQDLRNGFHVAFSFKGPVGTMYVNGKFSTTVEHHKLLQPYLCFGGKFRFDEVTGFIRDLRVYPRALDASEVLEVSMSCDGIPNYPGSVDDPSFGYEGNLKKTESCLDYYNQMANGLIASCPPEAQARCPVSCTQTPLCSPPPPSTVESLEMPLLGGASKLCLNTDITTIDDVIENCKKIPPFNESWAEGKWPSLDSDSGRRLGHMPSGNCPGGEEELNPLKDFRVVHDPDCDFSGSALSSTLFAPAYTLWWWYKRGDKDAEFNFIHNIASQSRAGAVQRSYMVMYAFQDDKVWLQRAITGSEDWEPIALNYVDPIYSEDPETKKGRSRWMFRAVVVNGSDTTYVLDDSSGTKTFRSELPPETGLEGIFITHTGPTTPMNISAISFMSRALTVQQLQQIFHATSDLYLLCPPGQFHDGTKGGQCSRCAVNTFTSTEGAKACEICMSGTEANTTESTSCTPCQPGSFSLGGSSCRPCARGTAGNMSRASSCTVCMPGQFAGEEGSLTCGDCAPGSYSPGIQEHRCSICSAGRFAAAQASTECVACDFGSYQPHVSASSCNECSATYTTLASASEDSDACTCEPGSYLNREENTCISCEGLTGYSCPGGLGLPQVKSTFYAEPVGDVNGSLKVAGSFSRMMVWRCTVDGNCEGDRDMGVCPPNMEGYGCSLCEQGYARSGDLLSCESCSAEGGHLIFTVCFLALFPIAYILVVLNHQQYEATVTTKVILINLLSIIATFLQFIVVILPFKINWPSWFVSVAQEVGGIVMLDPGFAKPACALGNTLALDILGKLLAPVVMSLIVVADVLLVNFVLNKINKKVFRYIEISDVIYTVGMIFTALYVMTCKATFSFIECAKQPSAPDTLMSYPAIECWSDEHMQAFAVFLFGLLIYVIGLWTIIFFLNVKAATLHHDSARRKEWRKILAFMVGKWQPTAWYWGQVYLTRNLLVSLTAVFQPDDGYFQAALFGIFVATSGFMTALRQPWRHEINNQADTAVTPFLVFIALFGNAFVNLDPEFQDARDRAGTAIAACLVVAGALIVFFMMDLAVAVLRGQRPEVKEIKRIDALATALAFMGKQLDTMDEVALKAFLKSIEPPERQRAEDFCMLMDDLVLHDAIKRVVLEKKAADTQAYIPHTPARLKRSNSVTSNDLRTVATSEDKDKDAENENKEDPSESPLPCPVEETDAEVSI